MSFQTHIAKRPKFTHSTTSRWSFDSDLYATSEILADIGVSLLEDDDDDSSNLESDRLTKEESEYLGPTPPCNNANILITPPKVKHHGNGGRKNQTKSEELTPYLLPRRSRAECWTNHDKFSNISDEIILQIFKWLPKSALKKSAQVCKRWKRLSYDESLWKRLDLGGRNLNMSAMRHIMQRGVVILRLARADITDRSETEQPPLHILNDQRFCKCQYLDLSMAAVSTTSLEEILSTCNKLHNLSLEHCEVNDVICRHIGTNTNLEVINLALCRGLTQSGITAILAKCQKLAHVNLAWTSLSKAAVDAVISNLPPSVETLNLSGCRYTLYDHHIKSLVKRCTNLEALDISDSIQITQDSLRSLCNYLGHARCLAFSRCYNISRECYLLLNDLPNLKKLEIFGLFESKELESLQKRLHQIQLNKSPLSTIARPTTGIHRTSIWGLRVQH